jgi:hypothetical protein
MSTPYRKNQDAVIIDRYELVTPHDSNAISVCCIGLDIGDTAGAVVITQADGNDVTLPVAANSYVPCTSITLVKNTGTTATTIHALY